MSSQHNSKYSGEKSHVSGSRVTSGSLIVAVEGSISSGKSTFLTYCSSKLNIGVYPEPIEKWKNVQGENLLSRFYENLGRWAMGFQMYVNMTVMDIYLRETWEPIRMIERPLLSFQ